MTTHNIKKTDAFFTKEQISHLKSQLLTLKKELLKEIYSSKVNLSIQDQELESYISASEQALLTNKQAKLLHEINYALQKITLGNYGICEITDEPIPFKRLEIIPYTTHKVISQNLD